MNPYDFYITPDEYEAAEGNDISAALLEVRIRSLGWSKSRAITTKPQVKQVIGDWVEVAEENGICYSTLRYRANRLGWDLERAATQPLQDRRIQADVARDGCRKFPLEILDLMKKNGIPYDTFRGRVNKSKWDMVKAATTPVLTPSEIGLMSKDKRRFSIRY